MVAIGFSVFKEKIISEEKRQTIRLDSKKWQNVYIRYINKEIVMLQLYWHLRRPDCELLKEKKLISMNSLFLKYLTEDQALTDGFITLEDALGWFYEKYPKQWETKMFWIIRW